MSRELQVKMVDDRRYEISQMNTTKSLKTLAKLTKILGEPMVLGISAFMKKKGEKASALDSDIDSDLLARAVRALIERMDEDEVVLLVKTLTTEGVICDHQQIVFDIHYEGNLGHLFKVLVAALEVQYGNFIDAILGQLPKAKKSLSQGIKSA